MLLAVASAVLFLLVRTDVKVQAASRIDPQTNRPRCGRLRGSLRLAAIWNLTVQFQASAAKLTQQFAQRIAYRNTLALLRPLTTGYSPPPRSCDSRSYTLCRNRECLKYGRKGHREAVRTGGTTSVAEAMPP